jgi:hypothetical protein
LKINELGLSERDLIIVPNYQILFLHYRVHTSKLFLRYKKDEYPTPYLTDKKNAKEFTNSSEALI